MRYEDAELKRIKKLYGEPMMKLVLEKSKEIAAHNPSGAYPVKVRTSPRGSFGSRGAGLRGSGLGSRG